MSPLELFRRNQKVTMTFLILLAMFAFVVLPTISQYMRSGAGMSDPVLAEFNGVSLTASRVQTFTRNHNSTLRFLQVLAQETLRRGGTSSIFTVDPRSGQVQNVGINTAPSNDMSIRTMQFAAAAQQQGFELDDTSIDLWLEQYTNGKLSEREMMALLRRETNNSMGQVQLYDMLRKQLLSSLSFRAAGASIARGQFPLQSPLDHWKNFLKLNQKATINTYGVLVNDFIEETDDNPADSEINAMYEAGKDNYPNPDSPEPGFRKRSTATFEYLLADLQSFRDAEVAKLSEDEIRAEYEKQKLGGAFQLPADAQIEPAEMESAQTEPAAEPPAESSSSEMKDAADDSAPQETEPAAQETEPAPQESKPAPQENADREQVQAFEKELEEAADLDADESDQSSIHRDNGVRLVTAQADESQADESQNKEDTKTQPEEAQGEDAQPESDTPVETASSKHRPFEEVRDMIAQNMVEEDARNAREQAISKVRAIMKKYSRSRAIYESSEGTVGEKPVRPDLSALADELGMTYSKIGPFDPLELADEPIAQSVDEATALSQRGVPFAAMMYGIEGQVVKKEVFTPAVSVNLETQQTFISWKTEETEAYLPELDECRAEVVAAIRLTKARELAKQAAETMAEKANGSASLADLVPEDRQDSYKKDVGPFSWLRMVGFGSFSIGEVPELDRVGDDFMEAVFSADAEEHMVASNDPKNVYYVIKRTSLLPATTDLKSIFSQQSERMMALFMSDGSAAEIQQGFFEAVDEKTGFQRYELAE